MKNNNFDGDVSVGRNLATGGDANIQGSATIGHNLKVKGWLEADNIKDTCKGMFETVEKLRLAYPLPKDGWWALVGDSLPAKIYLAEAGEWNASGGTSGLPTLDSQQLEDILGNFPAMQEDISNNKKAIDQTKENLSALQQQHTLDKSALDATIATEQAERSQTDLNLQEAIDAEVQSRTSEDNAIKQKLATETLNRQAGDNSLDGKITAETTARTDADTALGKRIDNLSTAMDNGDQELHEALRDEEHNRQSADTKLGERITTLENVGAGKVVKRLSANYVSNGDLINPENNLELISTLVDNKGAETTEKITIPSATNNNDGIMSKEKARFLSSLAGLQLFGASDGYSNEPVATNDTVTLNFPLMEVNNQGDYFQSDTGTDYVLKQATAIEAGLMSSDDKNKLDAMEDKIITRVLSIEETIRQDFGDSDTGLGNRITEETTARTEADKVLTANLAKEVTDRTNAVNAEATARTNADTALQGNIDALKATASADANGLMSKEDKATLDALPTQLTAEQTAREQADTAINGEIQGIKDKGTLHDLFLASGATYNQDTKMYQLNGLDLTFREMLDCYNATKDIYYTENWYSICQLAIFKTNILNVSLAGWRKYVTGLYAFANVPNLIKLNLYLKTVNYKLTPTQIKGWFMNDKRLKEIKGIDLLKILNKTEVIEAFNNCIALETIELFNLKVDISFNDSPLLSKESIAHLINHASPSSPITITLHPTAYAMAIADSEIQAELEKQPNISLAEGEPSA